MSKNSGFKNEKKLLLALNQKYFWQLNPNLKKLISQSFQKYDQKIQATLEAGANKSDIRITIGDESHTYSVKMGRGNSIHQEPLEDFLSFLTKEHQLTPQLKEAISRFIWADGTTNGSGDLKNRISSKAFKRKNPQIIAMVQHYFDSIKTPLLRRFLIEGSHKGSPAEFFYYGSVKKGVLCKSDWLLHWVTTHNAKGVLHIGRLTFQAWRRNLKGKPKSENKRGIIQLKWGSLKKDIKKIAKIHQGEVQEISFVKRLNTKEEFSYWKKLGIHSPLNYYAIRVKYQKYGKVNQKKVWAKADAFIAKGSIPPHYLKVNNYFLDEDDLNKFNLTPLNNTGISIKRIDSYHYQIIKMAPSTFKKLFNSNILAAGASIYYKKKKKLTFNEKIVKIWGVKLEEFFNYYSKVLNKKIDSITHPNCKKCLKKIKRYAKKEIERAIQEKKEISNFIFFGVGNFEEPFTAPWLYEHGVLKPNYPIPFYVTTGSGRSRGRCSIVLKPKKIG